MQPSSFYRPDYQDRGALPLNQPMPQQEQQQAAAKPKRTGWKSWVPMAVGLGATLAAAPLTGGASLAGTAAILGGAGLVGGGAGEWLAQRLNKEKTDVGRIAKEGVINGALSAVPIGKIAQGAKSLATRGAVAGGERVAERAGVGGVRNFISNKLLSAADDTALRASKVGGQKTAIAGFKDRFGEDLGTYIRKNGLVGKGTADVENDVIKGLNSKYGKLVESIDRPISSLDVLAQNQKSLQKLLDSGSSANQKLSEDVFEELDMIFKKEGDAISPKRLNEIKSEFQANAANAYKLGANAKPGVDQKVAEYLKKTLQGVSGSDELAATGKQLDKAYKASKILAKGEQVGRGNLSLGLTDLLAAGGGGAVGSVPGAVAAVAGKRAINSPAVQSFIANKLAGAGERIAGTAVKEVAAKGTEKVAETGAKALIKQTAKSQAVPRSIQALATGGAPEQPALDSSSMAPSKFGAFDSTGSDIDQANLAALLNGGVAPGSDSQYSREAMIGDIQRDPKNSATYLNLYKELNPEPQALTLSDSAVARTTDAEKALGGLDELDAILAEGYAGGKISGNIRKLNPFDDTFKTQQASIDRIRQIVGKALEGGVLRKEDEDKYKKILPTMQDQPDVYRAKVAQLRTMIGADIQNYLKLQQSYGKGAGQATGTDIQSLMMAQ
jgi:hypothetical protein